MATTTGAITSSYSCDKDIQTISTVTNEKMLKKKIKILQQKLRRQKIKIDNSSNFLKSLKNQIFIDEDSRNLIANNFNGNFIHSIFLILNYNYIHC